MLITKIRKIVFIFHVGHSMSQFRNASSAGCDMRKLGVHVKAMIGLLLIQIDLFRK